MQGSGGGGASTWRREEAGDADPVCLSREPAIWTAARTGRQRRSLASKAWFLPLGREDRERERGTE